MDAVLNFDNMVAAVVVAGLLGGMVVAVRLALREMYASQWWKAQHHWDD